MEVPHEAAHRDGSRALAHELRPCGGADAAKKEGKLLLYGRLLGGVEGTRYTEEFRKRYGIEVYFIDGGKA